MCWITPFTIILDLLRVPERGEDAEEHIRDGKVQVDHPLYLHFGFRHGGFEALV